MRALGDEAGALVRDLRSLLQQEGRLARAEAAESIAAATRAMIWGGAALVFGLLALSFAFVALMLALDTAMPLWAAACCTLAVLVLLAGAFGLLGVAWLKRVSVKPERTVRSLKEDIEWAKTRMRFTTR
jgi:uncharacterized membrane protein YqjE